MGLSGGTNTFELSGDVRDPTAVVLARIRKAQFARLSAKLRAPQRCHSHVFDIFRCFAGFCFLVCFLFPFCFSVFSCIPGSQEGADGCQEGADGCQECWCCSLCWCCWCPMLPTLAALPGATSVMRSMLSLQRVCLVHILLCVERVCFMKLVAYALLRSVSAPVLWYTYHDVPWCTCDSKARDVQPGREWRNCKNESEQVFLDARLPVHSDCGMRYFDLDSDKWLFHELVNAVVMTSRRTSKMIFSDLFVAQQRSSWKRWISGVEEDPKEWLSTWIICATHATVENGIVEKLFRAFSMYLKLCLLARALQKIWRKQNHVSGNVSRHCCRWATSLKPRDKCIQIRHGDARVHESSKQQRCRPSCRPLPSSEGRRRRSSSRSQETQIANLSPVFSCYVATGALSATAIAAKHGNGSVSQPAVNSIIEEWTMNG